MGIFNVSPDFGASARQKFGFVFRAYERVEFVFRTVRNRIIFTSERLITIDAQRLAALKVDFASFSYRSIGSFSIETAERFGVNPEMKISALDRTSLALELPCCSNVAKL